MKILAVRLAEVGCFSNAVAIEGLSGGLNVLAGANEAGKSTILAALRMAFEREYKTAHRSVEALRPYAGGAPLVEVDFAVGQETWRVRKQYLSGRMAELRNLNTGQIMRGADAEEGLAALLAGAGGRSSLSLLWAGQKDSLSPAPPSEDATTGLRRAIAAEIAATVGGSEARRVRASVRAELETFVTAQRLQPKGEYDAALKTRARLQGDLELALARRDAALARLDRLGDLKVREGEICGPAWIAQGAEASRAAEGALRTAREAMQKQRAAADVVEGAQSRLELARAKRDGLAEDLQRYEALSAEIVVDEEASRDIARALADAEAAAGEAREARDVARLALAAAERDYKAAIEAERRREAHERLGVKRETLAAAEAAMQHGLDLRAKLEAMRIDADSLRTIRLEDAAVRRLEDRLAAAAPRLTIAYAPGGAGRVTQDGRPLAEGGHLLGKPMVLTIEGVGTIAIAPGAAETAAAEQDLLDGHRLALGRRLGDCGAACLAEAEAMLAECQRIESDLGEARARLGALAPAGIAKLGAEVEGLAALLDAQSDAGMVTRADAERDIETARRVMKETEPADEAAQREFGKEREHAARHAATAADRIKRLSELERRLPAPAARMGEAEGLQARVAQCETALNDAVRVLAAWREQAPELMQLQKLESEAARAAEALRGAERAREELRRSIASLEGELRADRNEDVEARVAEFKGALETAELRAGRMADEVATLKLLDEELAREEMRSRDLYLRPVTERLAGVVGLVFPGADVTVAENFSPASLRRSNDREAIAALSEGTQEQLAVMVRLAFGRLMADSGTPVPVILDDALVYSDDERILRMFAALSAAGEHHQLIVLTCRSRTFESLAGHRLAVVPWQADATEAPRAAAGGR